MNLTTEHAPTLDSRVKRIRKLIANGLRDPEMRQVGLAVSAGDTWTLRNFAAKHNYRPLNLGGLREVQARDEPGELRNIYRFYKDNVRYVGDITGVDTFTSGRHTMFTMRAGDCDDECIAIGTLLAENGFGMIARAIAETGVRDAKGRPQIGHIYPVSLVPKFRPSAGIALDATLPYGDIGTEANADRVVDYRLF